MAATEQYFPVSVMNEILTCEHSNESHWTVLSCGAVYYAVQGGSNFWVCGCNPKVWPFKWKLLRSSSLPCGAVCYAVQGGFNFWVCGWDPHAWPFKKELNRHIFFVVLCVYIDALLNDFKEKKELFYDLKQRKIAKCWIANTNSKAWYLFHEPG